jgi:hypothetical protein
MRMLRGELVKLVLGAGLVLCCTHFLSKTAVDVDMKVKF